MTKSCLVIGDLNVDLVLNELKDFPEIGKEIVARNHFIDIGGSGGIFSAVLSSLDTKTYIISKIGNDSLGQFLISKLKDHSVNTNKLVIKENDKTGITINLSYKRDKYQISSLHLLNNLKMDEISFKDIKDIKHVHFSSYYMMKSLKKDYINLISDIKKNYNNITISLDTNDDPENSWGEEIYRILNNIDIFLANKKEALKITKESNTGDALNRLNKEVKVVVIKLGSEGYIARDGDNYYSGDSLGVNFKDSTGAGDNFDAGFIYGFINNCNIKKSLKIANIVGAKSVEYIGGVGNKEKFFGLKKLVRKVD
ncbi:ATP-dependent 6-phosphofructokinase [subsurface metagenome]|jgi:sugar/nucleoside kinase (ribokinase family)